MMDADANTDGGAHRPRMREKVLEFEGRSLGRRRKQKNGLRCEEVEDEEWFLL